MTTTTRAEFIRALAADGLERRQIPAACVQAGYAEPTRQAVADALKRRGKQGRPRTRCAVCTCAKCGGTWSPSRTRTP